MFIHIYRRILIAIFNLFSGMHYFDIKSWILQQVPGFSVGNNCRIVGPLRVGTVSRITIGNETFINHSFCIEGNGEVTIGSNVDIGPGVKILTGGHIIGLSEHRAGEGENYKVTIGNGCWIGGYCIVIGNVNIGDGSVCAGAAVVTKSVPDNVLVAGFPAVKKKDLD